MKRLIMAAVTVAAAGLGIAATPVYLDDAKPIEDRIDDLMSRMTLEEKVAILHAQSKFSSPGVPRLGIPELWTSDGPHGVRAEVFWDKWQNAGWTNDSCTAFPALTCLAATWNPEMSRLYGKNVGEEARYRKKNVLLGPGVNIYRTPLNGRNFEYMGEDPYLASVMCVPYIEGVQSNGVAACVKHFALNNQEKNRHTTNVILSDRALHEIYLPAFKAAVQKGDVWSVMGSYNLYRNQHGCHNEYLLNDILKGDWGFKGPVISDWGGTHDTAEAISNGLDLEFGTWTDGLSSGSSNAYNRYYLADPYLKLLKEGKADTLVLNDKVRRVLRLFYQTSLDKSRNYGYFNTQEHSDVARRIGEEGVVLLKNERRVLPLDLSRKPTILVVGENAVKAMSFGGGSSSLKVKYEVSPLDGLRKRVGDKGNIIYARGYIGDKTGLAGSYLKDTRSPAELTAEAVAAAGDADYVIFVSGLNKAKHQDCEDRDRYGLELPYGQDSVINAIAKVNRNMVVVNISGNAVAMPWVNDVPAIVQAWYLGSESGNALASVLTGDVNPSGKLPMTFPARLEDVPAHALGEYPGTPRNDGSKIVDCHYNEDIFVGYRGVDKFKTKPLFPFGHGLSYTDFSYGKPCIDCKKITPEGRLTLSVTITNTGDREGSEIVQLYISDLKSSLPRPKKELKGFRKVSLAPGESKLVSFVVDKEDLSYYDDMKRCWVCEPGKFEALVAASSADVRGKAEFEVMPYDAQSARYPKMKSEDVEGVMSEKYWAKWNDTEQSRIDADIERYRKADAEFNIDDCRPGSEVAVEQTKHDFVFGAHIFNFNQLGSNEANARYRKVFGSLFNGATVPYYWKTFEPVQGQLRFATGANDTEEFWNNCAEPWNEPNWRRPSTDQIVEFCKRNGIRMHGHVMVWGNRKWHHPDWMESLLEGDEKKLYNKMIVERANLVNYKDGDVFNEDYEAMSPEDIYVKFPRFTEKLGNEFDRRIMEAAKRYGDTIVSWDVVNESTIDYEAGRIIPGNAFCKSKYGFMPGDYPFRALDVAAKAFPSGVALNINDYKMTQGYADEVKELLARGAKIDILGAQMHLFKPQNCLDIAAGADRQSPSQVRGWMKMLGETGLPIHLSEITITSPGDDRKGRLIQAVIARNLYRLWFSNPQMMGITWWNVVDDCGAPGEPNKSGLFDRQMNPKTAYYALDDLLNNEWRTRLKTTVDPDGKLRFRGFKGEYKVSYTGKDGKKKIKEFKL